jgi:hypothetical protein
MTDEFFNAYLDYSGGGETPAFFNRWSAIGMIGAWMGRQVYCKFGAQNLHTNMYIMLLGSAGTKKSTAIKTAKALLRSAGYSNFNAEKISKEKFLLDLGTGGDGGEKNLGNMLDAALWGEPSITDIRETWIAADEFNDFFANNILDFVSTLGVLWDYHGNYENRIKTGQSVIIPNPTISILGGNTQTAFAGAFPPEAVGQGFFSRVIAVYAKPTGVKVTWPKSPEDSDILAMVERLTAIKETCIGEVTYSAVAKSLIDKIYKTWEPIPDIRFQSYGNRRLTHLLKLSLIHAASRMSMEITELDVVRANTVLHHAEHFMPEAYGEFGVSKNSAQTHKILQILEETCGLTSAEVWAKVQNDFDRIDSFVTCISGMQHAGKIQTYQDKIFPVRRVVEEVQSDLLDYSYLTRGEK